jgi:DinB superfamily
MHPTFERLEQELTPALEGLDAAQTQLRPTAHPDKWSIQQIVDHLLLTYAMTQRSLETRIAKGRRTQAVVSMRQRTRQLVLVTLGIFPGGRPAPAALEPSPTQPPLTGQEIIQAIHRELTGLDQLSNQAESLFGSRRALSHHVLGPLSIPQWRRFHLIHARHHLKQILAIRRDHGL